MFKSHIDRHLQASVENSFARSEMLMRPLMTAAALGSLPFVGEVIAEDVPQVVRVGAIWTYMNMCSHLCSIFWLPIGVRCVLLLGKMGSRRWSRSCCKCVVVACQSMAMSVISVAGVASFAFAASLSPLDRWTSPTQPLFVYLTVITFVCSVLFGLRHLFPRRKSNMIGGTPKAGRGDLASASESNADEEMEPPVTDCTETISQDSLFVI